MKKDGMDIEKVRLDKWLWATRFFKTRELAIKAIKQGKVLFNGQKANPSRELSIGVILTVPFGDEQKMVVVKALQAKRQSAALAQTCYVETPESIVQREKNAQVRQDQKWLRTTAPVAPKRPDNDARRKMRNLKRQSDDES